MYSNFEKNDLGQQYQDAILYVTGLSGAADGIATLDSDGKLTSSQLPNFSISETFTAASEAIQLALPTAPDTRDVSIGDICVRTDEEKTYICIKDYDGSQSSGNFDTYWTLLQTPTDLVQSVAGKTGVITLIVADISDLTATYTELNYCDGVLAPIQDQINEKIASLLADSSPQLGGNLDVNGYSIVSTSNGDIDLIPNGTGVVSIKSDNIKVGDGANTEDKYFIANTGETNLPRIRYKVSEDKWQFSNDGSVFIDLASTSSGLAEVEDDTTPTLGGNLELNDNSVGDLTSDEITELHNKISFENSQVLTYTVDEERELYYDDFSNDTSDNYIVDGTVTGWGSGELSLTDFSTILIPRTYGLETKIRVNSKLDETEIRSIGFKTTNLQSTGLDIYYYSNVNYFVRIYNRSTASSVSVYDTGIAIDGGFHEFGFDYDGTSIKVFFDGVECISLVSTVVNSFDLLNSNLYCYSGSSTQYISSLWMLPSISDSDDCSAENTAKWAVVDGTSLTFDIDHYDLLTDTTAARLRKKHYLNEEGYHKATFTLPTGADGDFIGLSTLASADISDGIGVGLMSDGAGNWNLCTLSGTTPTEGADSGLDDADVINIETLQYQGKLVYYIYDSTGTKPTTPTGTLFTTKTEGYSGIVALGNAQTFSISDWEVRVNTKIGDTNCESEKEYFFRDDFSEDSIGMFYISYIALNPYVVTDGYLRCYYSGNSSDSVCYVPTLLRHPTIEFDYTPMASGNDGVFRSYIVFTENKSATNDKIYTANKNYVLLLKNNGELVFYKNGISIETDTYSGGFSLSTTYAIKVEFTSNGIYLYINDSIELSSTEITYSDGYVGICGGRYSDSTGLDLQFDNIQISGTEVYPTPMLRGTQVGLYNDGDEDIVCSAFSDDFETDTSVEWNNIQGTWGIDTTNSLVKITSGTSGYGMRKLNNIQGIDGFYDIWVKRDSVATQSSTKVGFLIKWDGTITSFVPTSGFVIYLDIENSLVGFTRYLNGAVAQSENIATSITLSDLNWYKISLLCDGVYLYVYLNGIYQNRFIAEAESNYYNIGLFSSSTNSVECKFSYRLPIINIISPNSPNGISYSIPSMSHGGRYDTQESITTSVDMTDIASSDLKGYSMASSLSSTESKALRITAKNNTDDTEIDASGTDKYWDIAMDGSTIYTRKNLETNFNDMDDTIIWQMSTDLGLPDSSIYIGQANLKPIAVTFESDLI